MKITRHGYWLVENFSRHSEQKEAYEAAANKSYELGRPVQITPPSFEVDMEIFDSMPQTNTAPAPAPAPAGWDSSQAVLYENYEFVSDLSPVGSQQEQPFLDSVWSYGKAENFSVNDDGAQGYIYTVDHSQFRSNTGYQGTIPGLGTNTRLGAYQEIPATSGAQSDCYLVFDDEGAGANPYLIPQNFCLQFWVYINNSGSELSSFYDRNKFIYPSNSGYPSQSMYWLLYWGSTPYIGDANGGPKATDGVHWQLGSVGADTGTLNFEWTNRQTSRTDFLGPNLDTTNYVKFNEWWLTRIRVRCWHPTDGNLFEVWIRPLNGAWIKTHEYFSHSDPNQRLPDSSFLWELNNTPTGHGSIEHPGTHPGPGGGTLHDAYWYTKDFTITDDLSKLPDYPDY